MNPLNCQDVEAQLDLYAAGECIEPARTAIAQHLAGCPACTRAKDEAERLAGLLDLRFRETNSLRMLHARLEGEGKPRTATVRFAPVVARLAALAALLLLTVGLLWSIRPGWPPEETGREQPVAVALLSLDRSFAEQMAEVKAPGPERLPAHGHDDVRPKELTFTLDLGGKTPDAFRRQLREAAGTDRLPPPPAINLGLEFRNVTNREVRIWVGGASTELELDLQGPGAVSVAARNGLDEAFLTQKSVMLASDQPYTLPIKHLVYGARGAIRYAYWTEPGDYTLTARCKAAPWTSRGAGGDPGVDHVTFSAGPLKIRIVAQP
jgi:hypothetical protein